MALAIAAGAAATAQAHPDLTGVWSNASITQLNRSPGFPTLVVPDAQARALAVARAKGAEASLKPSDLNDGLLNGDITVGFNSFWADPGTSLANVKGQYRSSWIVDPPDGRLPLTPAARKLDAAAALTRNRQDPAGPENLAPNDRCIIGSRGSGGPGMLNNVYNSNYQIVQTPGAIAIVVEMVHDARTIPIFATKAAAQAGHAPAALEPWLGDSVAWWEGDALVVETVHVNPEQGAFGPIFLSPQGRVIERLTRVSAKQILYEFAVEDPVNYTQPWRAEMSLTAQDQPLYEYACHEGNYAMRGILGGARGAEQKAGGAK